MTDDNFKPLHIIAAPILARLKAQQDRENAELQAIVDEVKAAKDRTEAFIRSLGHKGRC